MVVIRRFGRYRYVCGIWRFLSCQYCGVSVRFGSGCDTSCRIPATPAAQAPTSHTPPAGGGVSGGVCFAIFCVRIGSISSVRGQVISDTNGSVCDTLRFAIKVLLKQP